MSLDDDINTDAADKMTSYEEDAVVKRSVKPTFRLGRRRSEGSAVPVVGRPLNTSPIFRRQGVDRRAFTFRLGRRSAFELCQLDEPGLSIISDDPIYEYLVTEPKLTAEHDSSLYKKDDDDVFSRDEKRGDWQPTFRLGRSSLSFRLGKRSSTNPTFRLGN